MASFTSVQNGDWNDGGVWGNASPGVKGTDWPGNAGDTASVGHTVNYNVSETNEMGEITITSGGVLTHDNTMSTKLTMGNVDIHAEGGGEYRVGASGAVIPAAFTAEVIWNTTSDNAKGIKIDDNAILNIYGDPTYYGSDDDSVLASNWTAGQTFTMTGDFTSAWNVGDEITVHKGTDYSVYNTDTALFTIANLALNGSDTDVTINEAAPGVTFNAGGRVNNVSRNVKLYKLGVNTAIGQYNSNRPRIYDVNASGNNNCVISSSQISGFYTIDSDYDFQFLDSVIRNGYYGINYGTSHTISGNVYSNYFGFYYGVSHTVSGNVYSNYYGFYCGVSHTISGNVYSNYFGFYYGTSHTVSGNVYSNNRGIYYGVSHTISGNVYSNSYGFTHGVSHTISGNVYSNSYGIFRFQGTITGKLGYDGGDVSSPNTYDFGFELADLIYCYNVKMPLAGLVFSDRNTFGYRGRIRFEHHEQVANAHKIYDCFGDIVKVSADGVGDRPSVDPEGGNGDLIELSNIQSNCDSDNPLIAFDGNDYAIWQQASVSKTYTFKVQTTYAGISAGNLKLTANYLDQGSGGHQGETTNAPAINQRSDATDWTQELAVTINPSQTGWIKFKIELMEYEAGNEVWIWPKVGIT